MRFDQLRQFLDDVVMHPVVRRPGWLRGVEVKAGALPQVVGRIIGNLFAARTGVRRDEDHAMLGGIALCARLGDEVLLGTGQTGQPVQHRQRRGFRLRWQIDRELHVAIQDRRAMAIDVLPAAEAGAVFDAFHACLLSSARPSGSTCLRASDQTRH
ncbi:MAG: hypothetical protein BWZ07_02608 [Alphaproteobacteria bacterium ADurb.BinA280]|nr:MAG: hypothetical protein BWZ07_02608 [Alphaproteobacteria bacterium ADurb.BinA280]